MMRRVMLCVLACLLAAGAWAMTAAEVGLALQALPDADLATIERLLGARMGVEVTAVTRGSAADDAGLLAGDVLLALGETPVDSPAAVERVLAAAKTNALAVVGIRRNEDGDVSQVKLTLPLAPKAVDPDAAIKAKLDALERAHEAGVISDVEYKAKRAELTAQLKAATPDPETQKKLAALDAALAAGVITQDEYTRKRDALLKTRPAPPDPAQVKPADGEGELFTHPVGFAFWHPKGWTINEIEGGLRVTPPDVKTKNNAPIESYFMTAESVKGMGVTAPDDPQVVAYLDTMVREQVHPALQMKGKATLLETPTGKAAILNWEAKGTDGGIVLARAYVAILRDHGVALLAFGAKDAIVAREAVLAKIATSFGFGDGKTDPALVGRWTLTSTYALRNNSPFETDYSRAKMVSDRQSVMELRADGTWTKVTQSHMIAGAGGTWIESKDTKEAKGRWNAANGTLYLNEEGGGWEACKYKLDTVNGVRQVQIATGQTGEIWAAK